MEYIFPMNGGDGAYSYTKNSQHQKEASVSAKRMFQEAIMQELEEATAVAGTVRIADLGCSVGPNTFYAMGNLVEAAEGKCRPRSPDLEFQVFFNDHISNDFNTLLASLPPGRKYHAAVVPGSFHDRLFPRASITLAHSSYAIHWLSRVPEGVARGNKGQRIFYAGDERDDVFDAYSQQFQRDMGDFLRARATEIVEGGLMFLILPGIAEGVDHARFPFATAFDLYRTTLTHLAAQGIIDKSEVDGFNIPIFFPNAEDVRRAIEENGCFCIKRVEVTNPKSEMRARDIMLLLRAAMEALFKQHFGESATEKMFAMALAKAEEAPISHTVEADLRHSAELFYVLKRT